MRIEHILSLRADARRPIRVLVVGAGGTGSAITMGLPYLDQALRVWGRFAGLDVRPDGCRYGFRNQLHPPAVFDLRHRAEQGDSTRQSHQPLLGNKLEGRAEKLRRADLRENSGHLDRFPHRLRGQPRGAQHQSRGRSSNQTTVPPIGSILATMRRAASSCLASRGTRATGVRRKGCAR